MSLLLTLNAGSSSLKFSVFEGASAAQLSELARGQIEGIGGQARMQTKTAAGQKSEEDLPASNAPHTHRLALRTILEWLGRTQPNKEVTVVSHRVVHGGPKRSAPIKIGPATLTELTNLVPLAPLHQPHNLAGIEAAMHAFPKASQVACFDTGVHRNHEFAEDAYALPRSYYDEGVRRYGFHGLSYEFIAKRLAKEYPSLAKGRVVVCHLGNGASICAMKNGQSIASTMGFTALDGLPMGTRCGQIDAGVVLYMLTEKKMSVEQVTDVLYKQSGLKGVSGLSNDVRALEQAGTPEAKQALDMFVHHCKRQIGALTATLGGLDGIVFTGGIGENGKAIRAAILSDLGWLGLDFDEQANAKGGPLITKVNSKAVGLTLATDEERMLAEHALNVLSQSSTPNASQAQHQKADHVRSS